MKDCSSCKNSPLNNSKLAGKAFEKTPCYLCVLEDQKKNREGGGFLRSCGDVEYDEILHGCLSQIDESVMRDAFARRAEKLKASIYDLTDAGKFHKYERRIIEMLSRYPKPSFRAIARSLQIDEKWVRVLVRRLRSLLSDGYEEKSQK